MKRIILTATAAAILVGMPAIAQMAMPHGQDSAQQTRASAVDKARTHFAMIDTNKDGYVSREEADGAREHMRMMMRERAFAMLDADKSGSISRDEFNARREGRRAGHGGRAIRGMMGGRMFARADADKDGRVSEKEAVDLALRWFDKVDANKDGTITTEERHAVRDQMRAQWKDRAAR